MQGEPVIDPVLKQRYRFFEEGDLMRVEIEIDPGGSVPKHFHPHAEERWEVLEGEVTFAVAGSEVTPAPGEQIVVKAGVRHSFMNTGERVSRVRAEVQPALQIRGFLEDGATLNREGKVTGRGLPTSFSALLEAAEFVERYKETTVLLFPPPAPPRVLQRILTPMLAALHSRRGGTSA